MQKNKVIIIKPIFFGRRINIISITIILITVLILKFTEIDKTVYVSIASVIMFVILMLLFYLNSREIQSIEFCDDKFKVTYFNKRSFFFRKVDTILEKDKTVLITSGDKLSIIKEGKFIGNIRLKALELGYDSEVLLEYFK